MKKKNKNRKDEIKMKLSENFFYTLREDLKDEESVSGNLLVKSGMFKKVGNGIYMKMPLGKKVAQNVEKIIREEMNNAGAKEVTMPMLLPVDLFEKSGRYAAFGPSIFKLNVFVSFAFNTPVSNILESVALSNVLVTASLDPKTLTSSFSFTLT